MEPKADKTTLDLCKICVVALAILLGIGEFATIV